MGFSLPTKEAVPPSLRFSAVCESSLDACILKSFQPVHSSVFFCYSLHPILLCIRFKMYSTIYSCTIIFLLDVRPGSRGYKNTLYLSLLGCIQHMGQLGEEGGPSPPWSPLQVPGSAHLPLPAPVAPSTTHTCSPSSVPNSQMLLGSSLNALGFLHLSGSNSEPLTLHTCLSVPH